MNTREMVRTVQKPLAEKWYQDFNQELSGFLSKGVRRPADVQDLAQEIYLRLLRVKSPELIESPRAYLYRIAVHVLDEWRSKQRRDSLHSSNGLDDLASPAVAHGDPSHHLGDRDLQNAIMKLPPKHAAALVLRWYHGMVYREIAEHLDITERMVKRYIVKGYAALRVSLGSDREHHGE